MTQSSPGDVVLTRFNLMLLLRLVWKLQDVGGAHTLCFIRISAFETFRFKHNIIVENTYCSETFRALVFFYSFSIIILKCKEVFLAQENRNGK